jgi:hypothetical protein
LSVTPLVGQLPGLALLGSDAGAPCHDEGDSQEQMDHKEQFRDLACATAEHTP